MTTFSAFEPGVSVTGVSGRLVSAIGDPGRASDIRDPRTAGFLRCGWKNCSKCNCAEFAEDINNKDICSRCGHSYTEHW